MSLGDEQDQKAIGEWLYDLNQKYSGHFGEIIMFPPIKDPFYAGLFFVGEKAIFEK